MRLSRGGKREKAWPGLGVTCEPSEAAAAAVVAAATLVRALGQARGLPVGFPNEETGREREGSSARGASLVGGRTTPSEEVAEGSEEHNSEEECSGLWQLPTVECPAGMTLGPSIRPSIASNTHHPGLSFP